MSKVCRQLPRRECEPGTSPLPMRRSWACSRDAGAVIIGKTNLHEFALGTTSDEIRVRSCAEPSRPTSIARRLQRRLWCGRGRRNGMGVDRHRHGWLDSHSSVRLWCRRVEADVRGNHDSGSGAVVCIPDHVGPLAALVADAWAIYDALTGSGHRAESASPIGGVRLGDWAATFSKLLMMMYARDSRKRWAV